MDFIIKMLLLLFVVACVSRVQGVKLPTVDNLVVTILDEEVIVHWNKPTDAPPDVRYNVEFARFGGNWGVVTKCTNITKTHCHLSDLIEYDRDYKVRVQLAAGGAHSDWTLRKVLPNSSELQPPSFTMWATSSTLTVHIHPKPVLKKIFPFGITYTIYLVEKAKNKTTTAILSDDIWDLQNEKVFTSLHWGQEYCVYVKVQANGGKSGPRSTSKCLVLPEQEWIIVAVVSLTVSSILMVTAFIAICILCYIKRPEKLPPALKSPVSGWHPLSVQEGPVEVVTDKGWFLFKAETEVKEAFQNLPPTCDQQSGEEDRRPSTDSGVSIKSSPSPARREDSGCGSIGVQDNACGNFPIQDKGSDTLSTTKNDDSGMGLSCHSDNCSVNLEELDSGCLDKSKHHSQRLLTVCLHESENDYIFKEKFPEPQLVSVVSGYRTNTSFCTCSGASLCVWCHNQSNYRGKHKGLLQSDNIVESYSSYCSNNQIDNMDQTDTNFTMAQMEQTFPMLTSLSSFPLMEKAQDLNMNDVSISLCDIELNSY